MNNIFETEREFNNKFKTKIYFCPKCKKITENKYVCTNCKNQSTNLLYKGFTYQILENGTKETILIPIEAINEQN